MIAPSRFVRLCCALVAALCAVSGRVPAADNQITVFAAASMRNALDAAIDAYPLRADRVIVVSYASSGALARQIAAGAPAHLYISANPGWADWLKAQGALVDDSVVPFLRNRLVLVRPRDAAEPLPTDAGLADRLGPGRLAIADPDHAPAGIYAREALESLGIWDRLAPRVARFPDARATLVWVERGEVAAGIVYESDARASDRVRVTGRFDPGLHSPIGYVLALVSPTATPEAEDLYRHLLSPSAADVFAAHGFLLE